MYRPWTIFVDPLFITSFRTHEGASNQPTYSTDINIIKEIKGDVKNQPRDTEKIWAPDGIRTHNPPCSRSDALTSELLRTRWRARVIFVGWTCEPHLAVTQSITSTTSNTLPYLKCLYCHMQLIAMLYPPLSKQEGNGMEPKCAPQLLLGS